jgi:hypothetical protein
MTSNVPYVVVIAGFAIFFVLAALTTASTFVFSALRWLRPFAWLDGIGTSMKRISIVAFVIVATGCAVSKGRLYDHAG